jgi:hypothetical protein
MATVACEVCADRYRRPVIGAAFAVLLRPLVWGLAALAALAQLARPRHRQPRLRLVAGNRPLRRHTARALRQVLDELQGFETKTALDLVLVQDRITRPDGEPLCAAVQRTRRGNASLLTIRLALHAHRTCFGPESVAATLADVLVTLYEQEAQSAAVLEVPARVPREAPATLAVVASGRNGTGTPAAHNGTDKPAQASVHTLAQANTNNEADGTIAQFKPRPGGPSSDDLA